MTTPLLGPDGQELAPAAAPKPRAMPTRQEKFNMVLMMFTLMTREERQMLTKQLRPLRRKLDLMYPNGMTEADIKQDMVKAAEAVVEEAQDAPEPMTAEEEALEREISQLSEQPDNAVAEAAEVGTEQSVPDQSENETGC